MKPIKVLLSLVFGLAVLLASPISADAIGFNAEEVYNSVFVIYSGNSLGSGFAIGKNCVVTNAHVIENKNSVTVRAYSGEEYPASIIGMDEEQDIAVLGIADVELPYLTVADDSSMNIGDDIYAIGAPKSMAYTLTKGVISAKERKIGNYSYIQIDAAINEGNSGGPLLDDAGNVVGMNTLKMSDSEGIGMAIPIRRVCEYLYTLGMELDAAGNVNGQVEIPEENKETPTKEADKEYIPYKQEEKSYPWLTIIAFIVAGASLTCNVILWIQLDQQKKKNINTACDPSERTDFEIDILE